MTSVLFLCTGNSARSQLAEAMLRDLAGDTFEGFSAGTDPQPIDKRMFKVLERHSVSSEGLTSKRIEDMPRHNFDFVITLCDKANQECIALPDSPGRQRLAHHAGGLWRAAHGAGHLQ